MSSRSAKPKTRSTGERVYHSDWFKILKELPAEVWKTVRQIIRWASILMLTAFGKPEVSLKNIVEQLTSNGAKASAMQETVSHASTTPITTILYSKESLKGIESSSSTISAGNNDD